MLQDEYSSLTVCTSRILRTEEF